MATVPRYLTTNAAMGVVVGAVFALALLATDTLGLGSLVVGSDDAAATMAILMIGGALTFAPLVVAAAIGALAER
jgi:hypothetical protein